jgi:hypothetical protein
MILNTIRTYVKKYKNTYGPEIIIACDSRHYWRREIYPHYKASRKQSRDSSGHDWDSIFDCLNKIREELKLFSPYKVIEVDTCEADDIIGTLTRKFAPDQKVLILSSDGDFPQLQRYGTNVKQYNPSQKKFVVSDNPISDLKEKIIRGDKGDGIPNILSKDDTFINGIRQKSITEVKLSNWMNQDPKEFCNEEMLRNFSRNQNLIDLTKIPTKIQDSIIDTYNDTKAQTKHTFMNYMITNRLTNLIQVIDEF